MTTDCHPRSAIGGQAVGNLTHKDTRKLTTSFLLRWQPCAYKTYEAPPWILLAQPRSPAERVPTVHDRARWAGHSLSACALAGAHCGAVEEDVRLFFRALR